ncbi:Pepsin inhibitor Dit33 [Aphelenchoides besseyi]|nr:Pepsin inhibitor Dit33 [Aphelenchoides besseyi]KAI6228101.1 Pepsin inhibitor Dit33 [Aphelenchoides besseyi]
MKFLFLLGLVVVANAQPVKRFAGFGLGGLSTIGGGVGCVVTGNHLYVNGLEGRELTADEQQELRDYEQKLATVRKQIKSIVEERRRNGEAGISNENLKNQKTPEAPKKPSFCSSEATTQYIFDGCKVQNNAVYVGNTYARKLTEPEIEELKQFDKEMSEYQKARFSFQQRFSATLESQLSELFGRSSISRGSEKAVASTASTPVEPPKTPNFCTLIV